MTLTEKLLRNYDNSNFVVKYKARFLLYLSLSSLVTVPVVILYSMYLQSRAPELNYSINWLMFLPVIAGYGILIVSTVLLLRGYFFASAHFSISILFGIIWIAMFLDQSGMVTQLDTIVMIIAVLAAMPIFITRKKLLVFMYAGINLCILYVFMFYFRDSFTGISFADYLADNTVAFLFTTIVTYNILSINNRALGQYETANTKLQKYNEELQATSEELTAANEEFEAQNEELMRSEEALRFSEAELLSIFNSTHDAMIIFDTEGNILDVNDRMLEMYGVDRARALQLKVHDLSAPVDDSAIISDGMRKIASGGRSLYEWKAKRQRDQTTFDVEAGVRRIRRRGKDVILAVVRDISDRKKTEEALRESLNEKIVLIKEIHHRVKNNMQVISSLLNMQADQLEEPRANQALRDAIGRIHSMASIHERIYSTENLSRVDMAAYIDELARDLVTLHTGSGVHVQINYAGTPVFLEINRAIPCGLLINEILTNAIKHGCCESDICTIDLSIEEADGWITLVIADNGPGMEPEIFNAGQKTSMGMQIIDALARQISAAISLDVDHGTRFTMRMRSEDEPHT
ncbi:MAG TPA: histidine kinase dimerization/phosphoacceptor domain -containing protein [Spirochaetota bacterium]|nr:histidine kinase dimerization/phosphoacceptor domain -containing protein [Spirochaetota bacterium]HPC40124.1 histidine kinase dimerization/phosphoacceptor domain -containing protein [Spirochaetota bacterium]HPL15828.1 histidine kinase dimerization/phosphoacceptor domain -containing protein [Spirochaetota bacterium]HQF08528.1 histidine kinase dimerization/phosphoacceptor domain -containing protein [Spirochaetota bacterium]HQH97235.1 histidine kinase dimerization/phosphoacceptor domain -contai